MYVRVEYPKFAAIDDNGLPAVGYEVYSYVAGTSTLTTTYSNRTLTSSNTNPIILNSRGEADIYVGSATKLILVEPDGSPSTPVWTVDYIGEQQSVFVTGEATPTTTDNQYIVDISPVPTVLLDRTTLVFTPDLDNADTLVSQSFSGTGINDGIFSGQYVGSTAGSVFLVTIDDATSNPNTFKWKKDGGSWTTGVAITSAPQALIEDIYITFAELIGHTLDDSWSLTVTTPATMDFCSFGASIIYKNVGGSLQALIGSDLKQDIPATLVYSSAQDCWILNNPSAPVLSSLVPSRPRKELISNYTVLPEDHGSELSCKGTFTVTLPSASTVPGKFFYVKNSSAGTITLATTSSQLIYGPNTSTGATTFILSGAGLNAVQITTNGVDWHIIATATARRMNDELITTSGTWVCPGGVTQIRVTIGGGGAGGRDSGLGMSNGSGSPGQVKIEYCDTVPGTSYTTTIGAGGGLAGSGGTTSLGALVSANGGSGNESFLFYDAYIKNDVAQCYGDFCSGGPMDTVGKPGFIYIEW